MKKWDKGLPIIRVGARSGETRISKSIVGNLADDKNSLTELAIAIGRVNGADIGEWLNLRA